jgi:hypothetical protein
LANKKNFFSLENKEKLLRLKFQKKNIGSLSIIGSNNGFLSELEFTKISIFTEKINSQIG